MHEMEPTFLCNLVGTGSSFGREVDSPGFLGWTIELY
jgi:hypothetical protein